MSACAFLPPYPARTTASRATTSCSGSLRRHCAVPKRRRVRCSLDDGGTSQRADDGAPASGDDDEGKGKIGREGEKKAGSKPISDEMLSGNELISNSKGHRRQLSAESRAKISAALKGRKLTDTHRQNIRKRLSGQQNPMYGKKLSAETRAKISQSMAARHNKNGSSTGTPAEEYERSQKEKKARQDDDDNGDDSDVLSEEENLEIWRSRAQSSKLLTSYQQDEQSRQAGRKPRKASENLEDKEIDKVLQSIANLDNPPDHVARLIHSTHLKFRGEHPLPAPPDAPSAPESHSQIDFTIKPETRGRRKRKTKKQMQRELEKAKKECTNCKGSGLVQCPTCVIGVGVIMSKCSTCYGAGGIFCPVCNAKGFIRPGGEVSSSSTSAAEPAENVDSSESTGTYGAGGESPVDGSKGGEEEQ